MSFYIKKLRLIQTLLRISFHTLPVPSVFLLLVGERLGQNVLDLRH